MALPSDHIGETQPPYPSEQLLEPLIEPRQTLFAALTQLGLSPTPDNFDYAHFQSFGYFCRVEEATDNLSQAGHSTLETIDLLDALLGDENRLRSVHLVTSLGRAVFENSVASMILPLARQRGILLPSDIERSLGVFRYGVHQDIRELMKGEVTPRLIKDIPADPALSYPFRVLPS